jgi:glycosyltransferase A (GT-A) superfamily protein (DUF2064 family)
MVETKEKRPMGRDVTLEEAGKTFPRLIAAIGDIGEARIVDEAGETVAIILSPEAFRSFRRERAWALIRQVQDRNAGQDPDEVLREVTEIVEDVRHEQYDRQRAALAGRS